MKRILLSACIAFSLAAMLLSDPALAQGGRRFDREPPGWRERPMRPFPPEADRRFTPPSPPGGYDHGRDWPGGRRLSPEERQQLRRDVFDHGRDVYRERPDRPMRPRR
jgi:hypothetical protein